MTKHDLIFAIEELLGATATIIQGKDPCRCTLTFKGFNEAVLGHIFIYAEDGEWKFNGTSAFCPGLWGDLVATGTQGNCTECHEPFDNNPGKSICKACEDWLSPA